MKIRIVVLSAFASAALGACHTKNKERVPTSKAMAQLATDACSQVYATDMDRVAACKEEYFGDTAKTELQLHNEGDPEALACMQAGGVLAERMPACADAMATLIKKNDENGNMEISEFFYSLGDLTNHCSPATLCELDLDSPK